MPSTATCAWRSPRYERVEEQMRGLIKRTPECALHAHVGVPDTDTAVAAMNGLREALPLLHGLGANCPTGSESTRAWPAPGRRSSALIRGGACRPSCAPGTTTSRPSTPCARAAARPNPPWCGGRAAAAPAGNGGAAGDRRAGQPGLGRRDRGPGPGSREAGRGGTGAPSDAGTGPALVELQGRA